MTRILTPSQTIGPLFGFALMPAGITQALPESDPEAIVIAGTLYDGNGKHLSFEAMLEFWSEGQACRVRTFDGRFRAVMRKPQATALPDGRICAPHLNIAVFARGLTRQVVTRMYFPDEQARNAADPVLEMVDPARQAVLTARPGDKERTLAFDIRLQGDNESVFFCLGEA